MAIFLRHSWNVKPPRWGSPADVQYAIKVNAEKIYNVDPDSIVLAMPLFWGLPLLDYSGKNNHGTNHGATYKDGSLYFDGNDYVTCGDMGSGYTSATISIRAKRNTVAGTFDTLFGLAVNCKDSVWIYEDGDFGVGDADEVGWGRSGSIWTDKNNFHLITIGVGTSGDYNIYFDGQFQETVNAQYYGDFNNVTLGDFSALSGSKFFGILDEVRISNVARTADQIALFHDLPWALYQPVNKSIYFFSKVTSLTVTLPCITAEISGQQAPSLDVTLPMITAEILGGGGGFLDATLPMITAEIGGGENQSGALTVTLPCITAEILGGGGGFLDATLPMITAEMRGGALLEATLPCITAEIEGKAGTVGEIDVTLPMIVADIEGKVEVLGDINAILPVIRAHITGKTGKVGSIDVALPMIEAALTSYQEVTGDLNATLPMITARIVGTPDRFATCTPLRFTEPI